MHTYHRASGSRNAQVGSKPPHHEPELTRGGRAIKRRRPQWSASLCNVAAELAGLGREVRHG